MFSTFCSVVLYLLVHFERYFRTFKIFIPWTNLSLKLITKTSLLPWWVAPSVGAWIRRCPAPSPPVILAFMVCSRRGRWSGMKGWLMRNHAALFLGPPAYLLLRTRLAWTRLMPTVYHLSKYVIHLGVAKQAHLMLIWGCGKIQNRRKKKKKACQQKPKQHSNLQNKKLFIWILLFRWTT